MENKPIKVGEVEVTTYTNEQLTDMINLHGQHIQTIYLILEKLQEFMSDDKEENDDPKPTQEVNGK